MKTPTPLIFVVVLMTFVLFDTEATPNPKSKKIGKHIKNITRGVQIGGALLEAAASAYGLANSIKANGRNINRRLYVSNYNDIYPYFAKSYPKPQIGFIPIVLNN